MSIQKGHIVQVFLNPPHDKHDGKERPAVVLVVNSNAKTCEVIAISTKLEVGDSNYFVEMPFGNINQPAKSGLTERCVAKVYWHDVVNADDCQIIGYISTKKFIKVQAKFEEYKATKF